MASFWILPFGFVKYNVFMKILGQLSLFKFQIVCLLNCPSSLFYATVIIIGCTRQLLELAQSLASRLTHKYYHVETGKWKLTVNTFFFFLFECFLDTCSTLEVQISWNQISYVLSFDQPMNHLSRAFPLKTYLSSCCFWDKLLSLSGFHVLYQVLLDVCAFF